MGDKMKIVRVVPHDPDWANQFTIEAENICRAMGEAVVAIHHIGSTSIPHIHAKPILDILLEVRDLNLADTRDTEMVSIGYTPMGEYGIPRRRFYYKNTNGQRTHHIHAFEANSLGARRHLAFRNYMRSNPTIADEYSKLKQKLAKLHPDDIDSYMDGKDAFIKEHEKRAMDLKFGELENG